jgi:hypothetical protein
MAGDHGLGDLRFEGYDNEALAGQVDALRNGPGSSSLQDAARALVTLAGELGETDRILRLQLVDIGVSWQGQAADGGTQATQAAAVYATDAVKPVGESAAGVATQSGEFSHTRNSVPDSGTLRGPTQMNGVDRFCDLFGHTTDHAKQVQATTAARDQAIACMNGYQSGSQAALGQASALPVPPGMDLVARPVDTGTQVSSVGGLPVGGGGGFTPGGSTVPGPVGGGGGDLTGGVPGGFPGGGPGGTAGELPGGLPGGPVPGQVPGAPAVGGPGGRVGVGPVTPTPGGLPVEGAPPVGPRGTPSLFVADAAAIAGAGAQGAAVGATAEKDRLVRGRPGGAVPGEEGAPGRSGGQKGATPLAGEPPEEARSVRNAERYGARLGRPEGNSILQPATGSAPDEEDGEHVRKFGVESGDLFEDGRMTSPSSIGDEDELDMAD